MLDQLPTEVVDIILSNLCQNALVNLSTTNTRYSHITKPHLFKSIEVDASKGLITDKTEVCGAVRVSTIYNLKLLMKKLINNEGNCRLIQKLVFKRLPDLPEDFLIDYFVQVFPNMANLTEFRWYSNYNLDLNIVNLLPSVKLSKLNGNFKNFDNFDNSFKHLESLSLAGFKNFTKISINLSVFKNLKFLKISKKNLMLIEDSLENLLLNKNPLNLTALSLENLFITEKESRLLLDKINFSCLKTLKLINCYEVLGQSPSLLTLIGEEDTQLEHLELDLMNNELNNRSIFNFLDTQDHLQRVKLNLNIPEDLIKQLTFTLMHLNPRFIEHLDIQFTLKSRNKVNCFNHTNQEELLALLNNFKLLKSLRFPIFSAHIHHLNLHLPHIETLHLSLIDYFRYKNCLVDLDTTSFSITKFNTIMNELQCKELKRIIIKLFDYHIYDVSSRVVNRLPQLVE